MMRQLSHASRISHPAPRCTLHAIMDHCLPVKLVMGSLMRTSTCQRPKRTIRRPLCPIFFFIVFKKLIDDLFRREESDFALSIFCIRNKARMMPENQELDALCTRKGSISDGHAEVEAQSTYDKDQVELARTGKKQVLKRNFGAMSMLGFSCTLMATWEGVLVYVR